MSEPAGMESAPDTTGLEVGPPPETSGETTDQSGSSGGGINPSWQPMLDKIPAGLHEMITPHLREWDGNFQKAQSKYAPYKDILDSGIPAEKLGTALQVFDILDKNPRILYDKMVETFGQEWGVGQPQQEAAKGQDPGNNATSEFNLDDPSTDISQHPKFQELMKNQETMANFMYQKIQEEQAREGDQQLDQELNQLKKTKGDFDEPYVIFLAQQGLPLDQAVDKYQEMVQKISGQNRRPAPNIMPAGGGVPSTAVDVGSMDKQDIKGLALQFIRNQQQQG